MLRINKRMRKIMLTALLVVGTVLPVLMSGAGSARVADANIGSIPRAYSSEEAISNWTITTVDSEIGWFSTESLYAVDADTIFIAYTDDDTESYIDEIKFAKSTDGGLTWSTMVVGYNGTDPVVHAASADTIFIAYKNYINNNLQFARSTDGGVSWGVSPIATVLDAHHSYDVYAVSEQVVFLAYADADADSIQLATSTDSGATWTISTVESGTGCCIYYLHASDQDTVSLVYSAGGLRFVTSSDGGETWTITPMDITGFTGVLLWSLDIAEDNTVFMSYYDFTTTDLAVAKSVNLGQTWTTSIVDTVEYWLDHDLDAIDSETVVLSYYDFGVARITFAKSSDGGSTWTTSVVDSESYISCCYTSLYAIDEDSVFLAYHTIEDDDDFLKVAASVPEDSPDECTIPSDGMAITKHTVLCTGSYFLPAGIHIANDNVILDCNQSTLIGSGTGSAILVDGFDTVTIQNCVATNYSAGINVESGSNIIIRNNRLEENVLNASGTQMTIVDNVVEDDEYALYASGNGFLILNNTIGGTDHLLRLVRLYDSTIAGNYIADFPSWARGISMDGVSNNLFENNIIGLEGSAIYCWFECINNTFRNNTIRFVSVGVGQRGNSLFDNVFYHNNFYINEINVDNETLDTSNVWDLNEEGNNWWDYSYESQGCVDTNADYRCDDPYIIASGIQDNYPFTAQNGWDLLERSIEIPLEEGWNLISITVRPESTSIADVLSFIEGQYAAVHTYTDGVWYSYDPTSTTNTLTDITHKQGYWIDMTQDATLTLDGRLPAVVYTPTIGWNLIGYLSLTEQPVEEAFAPIMDTVERILAYDASDVGQEWKSYDPDKPPFLNTLTTVKPGFGYWVKIKEKSSAALGTVDITVTDEETGALVRGAQITILDQENQVVASGSGGSAVFELPAGSYTVSVTATGYYPAQQEFQIIAGRTSELNIVLTSRRSSGAGGPAPLEPPPFVPAPSEWPVDLEPLIPPTGSLPKGGR